MGNLPIRWYHSLKVKVTLLLLLGGVLVGVIGVWVTYKATDSQLEQRLLVRVGTLAGAINHAAMAGSNWPVVRHMVSAIVQEEPDIKNIIVVDGTTRRVVAASDLALVGTNLDDMADEHLRSEIADALQNRNFGSHFESDEHPDQAGNLVVLEPLQLAQSHHGKSGETGNHSNHSTGDHKSSGHKMTGHDPVAHDHSRTLSNPSNDTQHHGHADGAHKHETIADDQGRAGPYTGEYRGVIRVTASKIGVAQGVRDGLLRYILLLIAAVVVILRIAYIALNAHVLRPLNSIHDTINRRKSGDTAVRVFLPRHDEISAVGRTLNETLDKEDKQGKQLSTINEQLTQAVVTAETANVAKSSFLANMSHELRTPLNAIIGFSDIMRTETLGPVGSTRYKEYSKDINQAGLHLLTLINDLLDLSKIEAEKDELYEEDIDVQTAIDSVLSMVRQRAEKNDVALMFDMDETMPLLRADERKVKQVLTNLLTNAIKFTPSGGSVTTRMRCHRDSGILIEITDTGIGIAPDDIPKALSQFGQVESDLNRKYEGSGLGLPLTKAIVELHGGTLELESDVGVGTTVSVCFPPWRIVTGTTGNRQSRL